MRNVLAKQIALGGVLGAAAIAVMSLGSLIPLATYVCPVFCMVLLWVTCGICGKRIGWAWYAMVSILSVLMAPDKEAAAVFVFLGFYPILKPRMDRLPLNWLFKLLFFNTLILTVYGLLLYVIGLEQTVSDFNGMGVIMTLVMLILGNVTFAFLDVLLTRIKKRFKL